MTIRGARTITAISQLSIALSVSTKHNETKFLLGEIEGIYLASGQDEAKPAL